MDVALAEMDRAGRIGRTTVQVGVPTALVTIGSWVARLADIDLNPDSEATDLPIEVAGAFVAVLTVLLAFTMNRRPPAPSPSEDVVEVASAVEGV